MSETLTPQQKLDEIREKNRLRQREFYQRNKERIKAQKREITI